MRYVAAYLLAAMGKGKEPSSADIEKILESVGIEAEDDKIKKVISELKGKDLDDVIAEGSKKLASVPAGGGGGAPAAGGGAAAAAGGGKEAPKEEKKEEKKEESEESDDDMGFGLFD